MTKTILTALTLSVALAGTAGAQQVILAHGAAPGNPRDVAATAWAEAFAACAPGTTVNVAGAATMGDDVEMLTSASAGIIQVTANSQGAMSQIVPEIGLLGLPFLFPDLPTAWEVMDGEVGQTLDAAAQNAGLKILGFWDNGIRHVSHMTKTVEDPADLAGMNIRTPPDQMTIDIFSALGASPAPLAFSELPTALQSGVFDGQENPLTNIYSSQIHDITKFITLTGHKYESTPVVAGLGWWMSLDEATQTCALEATRLAGETQRQLSLEAEQSLRATMEAEGVTIVEADRDAYIAATASVYDSYAASYPELVAALREAAGQ
ncbi:TRAP transporter substrate-binding protein [Paracoccus liaowanqingii]|uniref:TRAP transporter substrate-binding protein n=1 Tax=Paracoccus liaowanqingii TaxID=2560053 RepID=A0A4P7HL35_9RHOB|nr:TRAP transporter substrate-binding protein [Paracoccus liaowanqingii]QBX33967.1 TRAP transporter substrate-binding protein [Paracoccus liaowanqingii]